MNEQSITTNPNIHFFLNIYGSSIIIIIIIIIIIASKTKDKRKNRYLRERVTPTLLEHEMQRCLKQSKQLNCTYS